VLTNVAGVMQGGELVSELSVGEAEGLLGGGEVTEGMVPKLEAVVRAVHGGVGRAHVIDGRIEHALILELFTPEGIGTMVGPDEDGDA
jgi:acetylglutamate kinase